MDFVVQIIVQLGFTTIEMKKYSFKICLQPLSCDYRIMYVIYMCYFNNLLTITWKVMDCCFVCLCSD